MIFTYDLVYFLHDLYGEYIVTPFTAEETGVQTEQETYYGHTHTHSKLQMRELDPGPHSRSVVFELHSAVFYNVSIFICKNTGLVQISFQTLSSGTRFLIWSQGISNS